MEWAGRSGDLSEAVDRLEEIEAEYQRVRTELYHLVLEE
jgi:hypothetical protein